MDLNWAEDMNCAVTVCDKQGIVVYMNKKSRETFNTNGRDMMGQCMIPCHNPQSQAKIANMLATGESNSYTILKNGQKKLIYQTPWRVNGEVMGLVELSMVIPEDMPHFIR